MERILKGWRCHLQRERLFSPEELIGPPEASPSFPKPPKRHENWFSGEKTRCPGNKPFFGEAGVEERRCWGWEIGGFGSKKLFWLENTTVLAREPWPWNWDYDGTSLAKNIYVILDQEVTRRASKRRRFRFPISWKKCPLNCLFQ